MRDLARKHLQRGKLDCTLRLERMTSDTPVSINRSVPLQVLAAPEQVRRDAPEIGGVSPMDLLRWPGVLDDTPTEEDALEDTARELFEQALSDLIEARASEGKHLQQTLLDRTERH